jgi:DDE superfamily endonuclease
MDRPSDNDEQKKFFSGKKKQHTRKNQIVSLPEGKDIIDIKVGSPGPTADINLFREQQTKFYKERTNGCKTSPAIVLSLFLHKFSTRFVRKSQVLKRYWNPELTAILRGCSSAYRRLLFENLNKQTY